MNKIIHLIFALEVGGAENLLVDIANSQAAHAAVTVIIVNNKYDKGLIERLSKKIRIIYIGRKEGALSLTALLKIWKWIMAIRPSIIHCHQHNLIELLPFWHKKTVVTVHDVGIPTGNLKKYKNVFAISAAVRDDLFKRGGIRSAVIYNGISLENINRKNFSKSHAANDFKIVQISRLYHEKKGQHMAIEALRRLHASGYTNTSLYFIGDGPSMQFLKAMTIEWRLEKNVFFLGTRERSWIYCNLINFDLLIQPSLYEGFGLTIIEGISAGLPVVASNIDGPAEILKEMPSGFLFNVNDENDFVSVLKKVIDLTGQHKIQDLCDAAYQIVQKKYAVKQTADNYLKAYATN